MNSNTRNNDAPYELSEEEYLTVLQGALDGATVQEICQIPQQRIDSLYALAYDFYHNGNYSDALVIFKNLLIYDYNDYRFWLGSAGCEQAMQHYEEAIKRYQMACVASLFKNPVPMLYIAKCFLKLNDKAEAISVLHCALTLGQDDPQYTQVTAQIKSLLDLLDTDEK